MSYVIIRNQKLTRNEAKGSYVHNERRTRGHTNKDIDSEKTHLNYYLKKNELSYIKEFDRLKKEKVLENIKLELPEIPNINDIKLIKLNKEKVENEIIKPKDELIQELYHHNITLYKELLKQVKVVNEAEKYQKEKDKIIADNKELNSKVKKK